MKKQMIWGLAILMLLIGIAGVFLLIPRDTDTESEMVLGDATKKLLEDGPKPKGSPQEVNTPEPGVRPPPPGESRETGYWHGDHWHRTVPKDKSTQPTETVSWLKMSPEQLKEVFSKLSYPEKEFLDFLEMSPEECVERFSKMDDATKQLFYETYREERKRLEAYRKEWGEDPPPIGANWQHMRNHNGETLRHYDNTVTIFYKDGVGFAPTLEQWEQHEAFQAELAKAQRRGDTAEWNRISAQIETLIAAAQGPVPLIDGGLYSGDPSSREAKDRKREEAIREVYRKFGLEHTLQQSNDRPVPIPIIDGGY